MSAVGQVFYAYMFTNAIALMLSPNILRGRILVERPYYLTVELSIEFPVWPLSGLCT